jgi:hypothetical protein
LVQLDVRVIKSTDLRDHEVLLLLRVQYVAANSTQENKSANCRVYDPSHELFSPRNFGTDIDAATCA